jgi:hypothetical protein
VGYRVTLTNGERKFEDAGLGVCLGADVLDWDGWAGFVRVFGFVGELGVFCWVEAYV